MQHEVFVFFSTIPIKIAENFFGKIFITATVSMTNFNLKWKLIWRFDMKLSGTPAYIRHLRLCNWELCNNKLTKLNISETNSELSCVMLTEIWKQNGEFVKSLRARKINGSDIDIYQTWLAPCCFVYHCVACDTEIHCDEPSEHLRNDSKNNKAQVFIKIEAGYKVLCLPFNGFKSLIRKNVKITFCK